MPLYDFECLRGHRFEKVVGLALRDEPVPCEGVEIVWDEEHSESDEPRPLPPVGGGVLHGRTEQCGLDAYRVPITHAHPSALLDHGLGANRDAAREGRY